MLRSVVGWQLPSFRDNLTVPTSRANFQSRKSEDLSLELVQKAPAPYVHYCAQNPTLVHVRSIPEEWSVYCDVLFVARDYLSICTYVRC
jgi:hypothetical protein